MKKVSSAILFALTSMVCMAQMPMVVNVGTEVVTDSEVVSSRRYVGHIVPTEEVSIVAQVAGEIKEVGFTEGAMVKKGDVLYKIDDVKYMASLKAAEAQVAQCKANHDYAGKTYERTKVLFDKKVASADDMDSATSAYESSKAALAAAEANLVLAKDNFDHATITSPIDGKVGVNSYTLGNYVSLSSGPLTHVVSVDPIRLRFSISNKDYADMFGNEENLKNDSDIVLDLANGAKYEHKGKVSFTDNKLNRNTDSKIIYAEFANPDGLLESGASATLTLSRKTTKKLVTIPITAVVRDSKGAYVYVVNAESKAEKRDIVTGTAFGSMQYVESGLNVGEKIVVLGTHKVFPGAAISDK